MHTMKFRLKMNGSQKRLAEKRFRLMWRVHNQLAKHANSLINRMRHSRRYKQLAKAYKAAKEAGDDALRRALGDEMDAMRRQIGLTETAFEKYASVMQKRYSHHLSSHQVQKEADRVWQAAEAVIFRGGGRVNLKRLDGFLTISSKSQNGCHYADPLHPGVYKNDKILYPTGQVTWMGEPIKVDIPWHDQYTSFSLNHDLSYCEIHRGPFANGWHYYVILCLEGDAPVRFVEGDGTAGVDMGVSTACACSDDGILFDELVPRCREYNKAIGDEQRRIESSRRALNPGDYNADGTIKRGRHRWKISKRCRKHKWRKRDAHRRKRAYTKWSHSTQINRWLKKDRHFIAEGMDFRALAKRSKKDAERSEKESAVRRKDGTVVKVHKFKRKRRFGASVRDRSPGLFMSELGRKAASHGGDLVMADTAKLKASQYRHDTDSYDGAPLSQRHKYVGGHFVLRDPYSAFVLRWAVAGAGSPADGPPRPDTPGREAMARHFTAFLEAQTEMMLDVMEMYPGRPACFGF